ncbi:HEAT repeat domain-containing protein [Maribacter sp. ACAM166]|uniref:HEAT repeat domain-containing protein n=1 Tax=Maribacter sp. ACAM166 TaxID=2508996 RepID=UPI0010FD0EDD|nr:HEAT repeat domain-containing protein [Maribacter sp. ACAM166]TLP79700.1 HEAT repeat domain-containing protein [Maribacter sp. ACAM166]
MLIPLKQIKITLITAPEFNVEFLGWLTLVFLILAVVYFVGTFFIRNSIGTYNGRSKDKKMEFSPIISEFLFYEDSNSKEEKKNYLNLKVQIRDSIKDNFDRIILTEVLLDLRKDLSGQSQTVLIELYKDLELHATAYEKLSSRRWQVVSSGILELTAMEVLDSYALILKFINHRQSTIRKQAEKAVVTLKEEGINYFLDNTKYKISEWQQLKLLDVLRHKQNFDPPQFSLWLTSTNTHVVLFSLRLIKYYKQSDAVQSIITLLKHKNGAIQLEAIDCIKEFYFEEAIPTLKMVYPRANNDAKIAILDTLGEIGSITEVEFLKLLEKKEKNFNVKSKVISTLNKINPESILPTKNIKEDNYFTSDLVEETELNVESTIIDIEYEADSSVLVSHNTIDINESLKIEKPIPFEITKCGGVLNDDDFSHNLLIDTSLIVPVSIEKTEEKTFPNILNTDPNNSINNLDSSAKTEDELFIEFSPLVLSEIDAAIAIPNDIHNDIEPMFSLDNNFVSEIHTTDNNSFDAVKNDFIELDWFSISKMEPADVAEELNTDPDPLITFENDSISFSANFMEEAELETMVFLENIADMGDSRELPTLHQLLAANTSPLVLERINELIHKFSYQSPRPNDMFSSDNDLSSSVFTEIFNLSDTETKLILLDEIKSVGDEKEIQLLESLIENENNEIATTASKVLNHILAQTAKLEFTKVGRTNDSIFELDFELEIETSRSHLVGFPVCRLPHK